MLFSRMALRSNKTKKVRSTYDGVRNLVANLICDANEKTRPRIVEKAKHTGMTLANGFRGEEEVTRRELGVRITVGRHRGWRRGGGWR